MSHPESTIQCSNPHCIASNLLDAYFCNRCSTPIVKRYLWSSKAVAAPKHTSVGDRYFVLSDRVFLDTQPSKPPATPEEVSPEIVPYLQLFPCYPHVPQVYGLLDGTDAWLFDYGTVPTDEREQLVYPQLIPRLEDLWSSAPPLKQLNWLWQIVKLWKPLSSKKVASSLLDRDLIGINGQVVQLLQLKSDPEDRPSLQDLGNLWSQWAEIANPQIKDVVKNLATRLATGEIERAVQAIAILDQAIAHCQKNSQYSYRVYAQSDSGPSRSNNEDAAYPMVTGETSSENTLAIVCDGVGGHEGGEIASGKTIEYLQSKISDLVLEEENSSGKILGKLMKYINGANNIINERNDSEHRHERQRMGTTLVMALAAAREMYLAHVGDSRIYWITPNSCHQVTTDDDLASREVRLGYALYRDALQYPSAGALIQALGMRDSTALHPNLQRYVIDDECIFLLCTDGLSDFDRVEQHWSHTVLPVLQGKQDLVSAVKELIAIANEKNGHDNVTVALVHCQVQPSSEESKPVLWSDVELVLEESLLWSDASLVDSVWQDPNAVELTTTSSEPPPEAETIAEPIGAIGEPMPAKKAKWLSWLVGFLVAATAVGLGAYFLLQHNFDPDGDRSPVPRNELEVE